MTNASTQLRALEGEIERLIPERQCMRYTSGECRTLSCLKAGGYKGGSYDPNIATCEEHALRTLLTLAKELNKRTEFLDSVCKAKSRKVERVTADRENLRIENASLKDRLEAAENDAATLKRKLDEAMKELRAIQLGFRNDGDKAADNSLGRRITEIDKL